jgi:oligopeptide transport system ATP-binding protein
MNNVRHNDEREVVLRVEDWKKYFPIRRGVFRKQVGDVKAVDGVSFSVYRGETLGLVGESGCGKTTTGRTIIRIYQPTAGQVTFEGVDLARLRGRALRKMRRKIQMVFQDPYASLNPRMSIAAIVGEPLDVHGVKNGKSRKESVAQLLQLVGMNPDLMNRFPHEFSGGQRQRIGVARALSLQPSLVICDEPISALDVSIQAQVVNLLEDLQDQLNLTYIFIAHDLSMVRHISDRVAVMYLGGRGATAGQLYRSPPSLYDRLALCHPGGRPWWKPSASASCWRAICPARPTHRWAVISTRVPWRSRCVSRSNRNSGRSVRGISWPATWRD